MGNPSVASYLVLLNPYLPILFTCSLIAVLKFKNDICYCTIWYVWRGWREIEYSWPVSQSCFWTELTSAETLTLSEQDILENLSSHKDKAPELIQSVYAGKTLAWRFSLSPVQWRRTETFFIQSLH